MSEIYETILQSGAIGAILVWALWQNQKLVDRVIKVVEENAKILTGLTAAVQELKSEVRR